MNRYSIAVENDDVGVLEEEPVIDTSLDDQIEQSVQALEAISEGIDEGIQATNELDAYSQVVNEQNADAVQIAVEAMRTRLGMKNTKLAVESYQTKVAALENFIVDTAKKVWEAIKNMFNTFKDWLLKVLGLTKSKTDTLEEEIEKTEKFVFKFRKNYGDDFSERIREDLRQANQKAEDELRKFNESREKDRKDSQVTLFMTRNDFLESPSILDAEKTIDALIKHSAVLLPESEREVKSTEEIIKDLFMNVKKEIQPGIDNEDRQEILSKLQEVKQRLTKDAITSLRNDVYYSNSAYEFLTLTGGRVKGGYRIRHASVSDLVKENQHLTGTKVLEILSKMKSKISGIRGQEVRAELMQKKFNEMQKFLTTSDFERMIGSLSREEAQQLKSICFTYIKIMNNAFLGFINNLKMTIKAMLATAELCKLYASHAM